MTDYRVKWGGALPGGSRWSCSLYVTSAQTQSALLTTMESALTDAWTNGAYGVGSLYHSDTTLDSIQVATLNGIFHETSKDVGSIALPGTSSDNPVDDASTLVVLKRSTGLQRNQRGSLAWPAPVEGTLSGGLYQLSAYTRFGNACEAIRAAVGADGSTIFVHTGATTTKGGVPPYTKTVITRFSASNKPGTRRQRTRKVRPTYS